MSPFDENANPALGAAIRRLREQRGVTQEDAAHDAGVTVGTLSKLERGESDPRWTTIERVAAALGVSLRDLGGEVEREP
jgi:transcriptional regulator with XRE-family HTH domain